MAKLILNDITDGDHATAMNANLAAIEAAIENTVSRDGTAPNNMTGNLDMNSNRVLNLPDAVSNQEPVTKTQLDQAVLGQATLAASNVTVADTGALFTGTDAEAVLAEIDAAYKAADTAAVADYTLTTDLASTANAKGASLIGIEDSGGLITATTVEGALAELAAAAGSSVTKYKTADQSKSLDTTLAPDTHLQGFILETGAYYKITGFLDATAASSTPDIKFEFTFTNSPQQLAISIEGPELNTHHTQVSEAASGVISLGTAQDDPQKITGHFQANATTGGTMDLDWAQNASAGNAVTLRKGSWITIEKIS